MAVYTITIEPLLPDGRHRAGRMARLVMTTHTPRGKDLRIVIFVYVYVVTRRAIHLGRPETFAGGKQPILIRMHVQHPHTVRGIPGNRIIVQAVPYLKGKARLQRRSNTRMAKRTRIQP